RNISWPHVSLLSFSLPLVLDRIILKILIRSCGVTVKEKSARPTSYLGAGLQPIVAWDVTLEDGNTVASWYRSSDAPSGTRICIPCHAEVHDRDFILAFCQQYLLPWRAPHRDSRPQASGFHVLRKRVVHVVAV